MPARLGSSPTVGIRIARAGRRSSRAPASRRPAATCAGSWPEPSAFRARTSWRAPERVLTTAELQLLRGYVERRRQPEPVSRILGERRFLRPAFAISPATLDPRPDSETLIAAALEIAREEGWMSQPLRILDVGTGSGCLLLTLLCELPQATGLGTDISPGGACGGVPQRAVASAWSRRAAWLLADGLENVAGPFHMLVANPPYVRTADIAGLEPEVRDFDPIEALDGGPMGWRSTGAWRQGLLMWLRPAGWVVLEVGHDQADLVAALLGSEETGMDARANPHTSRCRWKATLCCSENTWLNIRRESPWIFPAGGIVSASSGIVHASGQRSFDKRMAGF